MKTKNLIYEGLITPNIDMVLGILVGLSGIALPFIGNGGLIVNCLGTIFFLLIGFILFMVAKQYKLKEKEIKE